MIAQLDRKMLRAAPGRSMARLIAYFLFEGRPLTTRGRWWNPITFANLRIAAAVGRGRPRVPIFIIGMGRSGTTLLGRLLAMHPDVGFLNEPKALWHVARADEDIIGSYGPPDSGRMYLGRVDADSDVRRRAGAMFAWFAALSRSKRVVEKYPELLFRRDLVRAIFPDARFLIAVRSPADTLASVERWSEVHGDGSSDWWGLRDQKWRILWDQVVAARESNADLQALGLRSTDSHRLRAAVEWIVTMREAVVAAEEPDTMVVSYEQLAGAPSDVLTSVIAFCDLPASQAVLRYATEIVDGEGSDRRADLDGLPEPITAAIKATQAQLVALAEAEPSIEANRG